MPQVIRVIWRFDYAISYAYMDNVGTALKALSETVPGFLSVISEGMSNDSFTGERRGNGEYTTLSLERNALVGSMEWKEGIELSWLPNHDNFRNCDKTAKALLQLCQVKNINRAGIRFYFVEQSSLVSSYRSSIESFLNSAVLDRCESVLGKVGDIGVVVEGEREDKLSYRANFGPLAYKNLTMALTPQVLGVDFTEEFYRGTFSRYNLFCDLDVYESNFLLVEPSVFRWSKSKFDLVAALAKSFSDGAKKGEI